MRRSSTRWRPHLTTSRCRVSWGWSSADRLYRSAASDVGQRSTPDMSNPRPRLAGPGARCGVTWGYSFPLRREAELRAPDPLACSACQPTGRSPSATRLASSCQRVASPRVLPVPSSVRRTASATGVVVASRHPADVSVGRSSSGGSPDQCAAATWSRRWRWMLSWTRSVRIVETRLP